MRTLLLTLLLLSVTTHAQAPYQQLNNSEQLIVVLTDSWNSVTGLLQTYQRNNTSQPWQAIGNSIPIVLGKSGMGIASEMKPYAKGPIKREGDGKSPAGIFPLTTAFGFEPANTVTGMPYTTLAQDTVCVDDANSKHYNTIVHSDSELTPDWQSGEQMRDIPIYQYGVVVGYNQKHTPKAGSCVFLHIWKGSTNSTAGCTAMPKARLLQLLAWLNPKKHPLIVQAPLSMYQHLPRAWGLPRP